jgi:hypothetical protein
MVVFDVNDPTSFSNVKQWLQEVDRYACESVSKVLVGGKADQPHRAVDYNTAKDFADALGMPYIETSAKTGENVDQAFLTLTSLISTYVKQPNLSADSHYTDRPYSSLSLSFVDRRVGCPVSLNPTSIRLDAQKAIVYGSDDDAESFSEGELDEELIPQSTSRPSECKPPRGGPTVKHKMTDVNVFKLDLSNLAQQAEVLTGDPVICKHCGVMFDKFSQTVMLVCESSLSLSLSVALHLD